MFSLSIRILSTVSTPPSLGHQSTAGSKVDDPLTLPLGVHRLLFML